MPIVTVRGPIPASSLGLTNSHEHLFIDTYRITRNGSGMLNDERIAIDEARRFKAAGGTCIVDATSIGLGRRPEALKRVSEAVDLHIVMGTGWYRDAYFPPELLRRPTRDLAAEIVRDLLEGVGDTGIRAGIIGEVGTDFDCMTPAEERVFRAAAKAQQRTGAAITTHAYHYPMGVEQLEVLGDAGADLRRVVIGHCDSYLDPSYHEAILKRGAWVEFDLIGKNYVYPDEMRIDSLLELTRQGHGERILLSSDVCLRSNLHRYGGYGYDHLITSFLPKLRARGMSEELIQLMMVENPRRILDF